MEAYKPETYKIIDSSGSVVFEYISQSLFDYIMDLDTMIRLYGNSRYTQAEQLRDKNADKLDDVMRGD